jgi:hypothetical protein
MQRGNLFTASALLIPMLLWLSDPSIRAQQLDSSKLNQSSETALAKARQDCNELWADHKFDRLRVKIPLGLFDEKPTFAMLNNSERLHPKDRPLADLVIKTLEQCRKASTPFFELLPPRANAMIEGMQRRQDASIAELYSGKITFGEYNIKAEQMIGEFIRTFSTFSESAQPAPPAPAPLKNSSTVSEKELSSTRGVAELSASPKRSISHDVRLALVIGDSSYVNLPKLANPARDASAIADLLRKMGFSVKLVKDATESDLRREVRKFANDSEKADIAFVYYAGHGAQVSGENYILPIDISIPETESDIQLTGLKVDDLVNSIRARTKIVFLDACRDNPALFKNLVRGRGSYTKGLAPAAASNIQQGKAGGGVFIAYATDSGSVALDGDGEHSPFTQALLRNLTKPISIDDMFSLVTREVRLVTKNAQRPYKYASLENIVCLSVSCSSDVNPAATDIIRQAVRSESEDLQIALQTKNPEALDSYLVKYPDSSKRNEVLNAIIKLKRSEYDEWTMFEVANKQFPIYLRLSSVEQFGNRAVGLVKTITDPASFLGQKYSEAAHEEYLSVYDCTKPQTATAEVTVFNKSAKILYHYKWADPQYLDLSIGSVVNPGTVAYQARNILCHQQSLTPILGKKEIDDLKLPSLSSTASGNGDIFYKILHGGLTTVDQKEVVFVVRMHEDAAISFPTGTSVEALPIYRTELDFILLRCDSRKFSIRTSEYFNALNKSVYLSSADFSRDVSWSEFTEQSPYSVLQQISCKPDEAQ